MTITESMENLYKEKGACLKGKEKDVVDALIKGMPRTEICDILDISIKELYKHTSSAVAKMKRFNPDKKKFIKSSNRLIELSELYKAKGAVLSGNRKKVVELLLAGHSRESIAEELKTTVTVIYNQCYNAIKKMKKAPHFEMGIKQDLRPTPEVVKVDPITLNGIRYIPEDALTAETQRCIALELEIEKLRGYEAPPKGLRVKVKSISYRKLSGGVNCVELILSATKELMDKINPDEYVRVSTD